MSKIVYRHEGVDGKLSDVIERAKTEIKRAMLPICSNCKKIRDEDGTWQDLPAYFRTHFDAHFTHGICPECAKELYPEAFLGDEEGDESVT